MIKNPCFRHAAIVLSAMVLGFASDVPGSLGATLTDPLYASIDSPQIYWTSMMTGVRAASPDGLDVEVMLGGYAGVTSIAIDRRNGKAYWVDDYSHDIRRANLDGSDLAVLVPSTATGTPASIDVDSYGGKIYWTAQEPFRGVWRANLDGTQVEQVIDGSSGKGIVRLDLRARKIYWVEDYGSMIRRANLDGSNIEDLGAGNYGYVSGLAIDHINGKMYWTDLYDDKVRRSNLDGSELETIVDTLPDGTFNPSGIAIDTAAGQIFWGASGPLPDRIWRIQRANLDGSGSEVVYFSSYYDDVILDVIFVPPLPAEVWVDDDWFGCASGQAIGGHICGFDAFPSIQSGIESISENGTVNVAPGVYSENLSITKNGLELRGSGAPITQVDGGSNGSVLYVKDTVVGPQVSGFAFSNGSGNWIGSYTYGGAILIENGSLVLADSIIVSNSSSDGAGGIEARDSRIELYGNNISNNHGWWGAAISLRRSEADISANVIEQNYCGYGGTIWVDELSVARINNNQITRNPCHAPAIGIASDAIATIVNNTIVDNFGRGIATGTYYTNGGPGGSAEIFNNIIWGNQEPLVNLTATYSDTDSEDAGEGNLTQDPEFVDRAGGNYQVAITSPVIDAGTETGVSDFDLIGTPRTADGDNDGIAKTDMGAFEIMGPFCDISPLYWAVNYIEILSNSGITAGCGNYNYCPDNPVTRAQMAVFLERGIHGSDYQPPVATGSVFLDVSASDFAAAFIEQLFVDGITSGCGNSNYCPNGTVTRAQMAVFLLRAMYGADYSPPPAVGVFDDVDLSFWAARWIEQLAAEGITSGCGSNNFCPDNPVTRAQMAVFLVRAFELL